jgi:DNA-binding NarL/FixJ family response regulator
MESHTISRLSARERQVAVFVARGWSNRAIAKELFLSHRTAECHVQHILDRFGFRCRAQIATWVALNGLIPTLPEQAGRSVAGRSQP